MSIVTVPQAANHGLRRNTRRRLADFPGQLIYGAGRFGASYHAPNASAGRSILIGKHVLDLAIQQSPNRERDQSAIINALALVYARPWLFPARLFDSHFQLGVLAFASLYATNRVTRL